MKRKRFKYTNNDYLEQVMRERFGYEVKVIKDPKGNGNYWLVYENYPFLRIYIDSDGVVESAFIKSSSIPVAKQLGRLIPEIKSIYRDIRNWGDEFLLYFKTYVSYWY